MKNLIHQKGRCLFCAKKTSNSKFCSRSCSASFNNAQTPKRKAVPKSCWECETAIYTRDVGTGRLCLVCRDKKKMAVLYSGDPKLRELIRIQKNRTLAFKYVRWHARRVVCKNSRKVCEYCGFSRHIEVCHKIPIKRFPVTARLSEINNRNNILILCPNHHWEQDCGGERIRTFWETIWNHRGFLSIVV